MKQEVKTVNPYEKYNKLDKFLNNLLQERNMESLYDDDTLQDICNEFLGDWDYNINIKYYYGYLCIYEPFGNPLSSTIAYALEDKWKDLQEQEFVDIFSDYKDDWHYDITSKPEDSVRVSLT